MIVFMHIRPIYVQRILQGLKRYEFRSRGFRGTPRVVVIYATAPVKRVVGYFTVSGMICGRPQALWRLCEPFAGISREDFDVYYRGKTQAVALEIGAVIEFPTVVDVSKCLPGFAIPQSYRYMDTLQWHRLLQAVNTTEPVRSLFKSVVSAG